jgi:hypothetical protein
VAQLRPQILKRHRTDTVLRDRLAVAFGGLDSILAMKSAGSVEQLGQASQIRKLPMNHARLI